MSYTDTVNWLFGLQFFGVKPGLENIFSMAARRGNPHRSYPVVHIAGTNGKGSTAGFIASALTAAGYRTGLYTSPHLEDFTERIRIDGQPITSEAVVRYAAELRPEVEERNVTFFEVTTLIAFQYFSDNNVDVAVIETGMGGRLDATNIVEPLCSVITGVSLDHTEFLGETSEKIAFEKAGIIKQGVHVVSGVTDEHAARVVADRSTQLMAPLHLSRWQGSVEWTDFDTMNCTLGGIQQPFTIGLVGRHQATNANTALNTLHIVKDEGFKQLTEQAIRNGFRNIRHLSGIRGRLQQVSRSPEMVVDAGHNPEGLRVMLDTWCELRKPDQTHAVFGVMKSKDHNEMIAEIAAKKFASITFVQAASHDAQTLSALLNAAERQRLLAGTERTVRAGVDVALERCRKNGATVLLFGSHYVLGDFFKTERINPPD